MGTHERPIRAAIFAGNDGCRVAIFDYNNDGWMDTLFADSGSSSFYRAEAPFHLVLYRNNGNGTFTDVSKQAGLTANLFGQRVALGNYDGPGDEDIFITGFGKCALSHQRRWYLHGCNRRGGINAPQWAAARCGSTTTTTAS